MSTMPTLLVVVVCTSRTEVLTQRSQFFTQFAVVSTVSTSLSDICTQWHSVGNSEEVKLDNIGNLVARDNITFWAELVSCNCF